MKQYFVYIMTNKKHNVLYTGVTGDLEQRIYQHKLKAIPGFTRKYHVTKCVYFEEFSSPNDAIASEKKIKGWLRSKKIKLIESRNPSWLDLSI